MDTIVDIKCELMDNFSQEVMDPSQLEQIFIDCSKVMTPNDELCPQIDTTAAALTTLITTKENYAELEGQFEWKCLYCATVWKKFTKLKQHLRKHSTDPLPASNEQYTFKCALCSSEFYDLIASRQHVKTCHEAEPIECATCGKKFVSTQLLNDHMEMMHAVDDGKAEATKVSKRNNQPDQNQTNKKTLLSQFNTFLCILCNKTFNGTLNLMQHTFVHFNLKNFSCTHCPAAFFRMDTYKDHMAKNHSTNIDDQPIFNIQCRFCSDKVENLFEFVTHTFTHHLDEGNRNNSDMDSTFSYDCRFCFKHFTKWNDAHRHLEVHASDALAKGIPVALPTERIFSERAKNGLCRAELLYNCGSCMKTLRGSFEARNHCINEHKKAVKMEVVETVTKRNEKVCFKCHDCDDAFGTEINLMRHRLTHFKVQPYRCLVCAKRFSVSRNAALHMTKIHDMNPEDNFRQLDCHYCQAEFTEEDRFIAHMFDEHLYVNFDIEQDLDGQCKYECRYCNQILHQRSGSGSMAEHLQIHQDETIPNVEPDAITAAVSPLNALRHNVEFLYCCVYCPKKFRLPHTASEHVKYKHKTEKKNVEKTEKKPATRDTRCELCNTTFLTWRSMLNHRAKLHPETHKKDRYKNAKTFYCSTCGKAYRDRGNLNQHEETHNKRSNYTCDICNKTYRTKNYIHIHLLSHRKEKNFICEQCGRSFYSISKLNTHYQIHQNLKLKCDQCDKVFFTRYNLSKHKKIHTSETRIKCKLCDNYFKSTNSYRTHMLLHTGVKKYACRYCDMSFSQSSGRRGHEKIKHQIA